MSDERESPSSERQNVCGAAILLALASVALYAPTANFGFVDFDDTRIVLGHANLFDPTSLWASLRAIFVEHFPREEPLLLRDLNWAIEARLFGLQPQVLHVGNILLNAINPVLLFLFLRTVGQRTGAAFVIAGLFAVVPLHVEPVAWVMGRKDLLSAFFVLSALLAQTRELDAEKGTARHVYYVMGIVFLVCALFSKISAVTAFGVLAAHRALLPHLRGRVAPEAPLPWRRMAFEIAPRMAPHAAASFAVFLWYHGVLSDWGLLGRGGPSALDPLHVSNVLLFSPLVLGLYLQALAWPVPLSAYYPTPNVEIALSTSEVAASAGIAFVVVAVSIGLVWKRRDLLFYWAAFFLLHAPYLGFAYVGFWRADRYLYLSCFCLIALGVIVTRDVIRRWGGDGSAARVAALAMALCIAVGWSVRSVGQIPVWENAVTLWGYEARLDAPSLLAIESHAKHLVRAAERSQPSLIRDQLIREAQATIARGFAYEQTIERKPTPYRAPDRLQLAKLQLLESRLARLMGAPISQQIRFAEQAFRTAPHRASALHLAELHMQASAVKAGDTAPDQEAKVRESFDYFTHFIALSGADPKRRSDARALLRSYDVARFPFLQSEVAALERVLEPWPQ